MIRESANSREIRWITEIDELTVKAFRNLEQATRIEQIQLAKTKALLPAS
jgi:hypothetical protein